MSLTPPKFVQMLRDRDRKSLVADLRALADKWEREGFGDGNSGRSARELREVLDAHT